VSLESAAVPNYKKIPECSQILHVARYEGEHVNREVWAENNQNSLSGSAGLESSNAMQSKLHRISSNFAESLRWGKYVYRWRINSSNTENNAHIENLILVGVF
jgi:uncharacterized protein YaeQ